MRIKARKSQKGSKAGKRRPKKKSRKSMRRNLLLPFTTDTKHMARKVERRPSPSPSSIRKRSGRKRLRQLKKR